MSASDFNEVMVYLAKGYILARQPKDVLLEYRARGWHEDDCVLHHIRTYPPDNAKSQLQVAFNTSDEMLKQKIKRFWHPIWASVEKPDLRKTLMVDNAFKKHGHKLRGSQEDYVRFALSLMESLNVSEKISDIRKLYVNHLVDTLGQTWVAVSGHDLIQKLTACFSVRPTLCLEKIESYTGYFLYEIKFMYRVSTSEFVTPALANPTDYKLRWAYLRHDCAAVLDSLTTTVYI